MNGNAEAAHMRWETVMPAHTVHIRGPAVLTGRFQVMNSAD